jgi:hypothetical protein
VDVKTGKYNFTSPVKEAKTGKPLSLFAYDGKPCVFAEGGLSSYSATGALSFAFKLKEPYVSSSELIGDTYFMANDDGVFALDLHTGNSRGKYEYMKGFRYGIKQDGKSLFLLGEKKVIKHTIN